MAPTLQFAPETDNSKPLLLLIRQASDLSKAGLGADAEEVARLRTGQKASLFFARLLPAPVLVAVLPENKTGPQLQESARQAGFGAFKVLKEIQAEEIQLADLSGENLVQPLAEGLALSSYTFKKYKEKKENGSKELRTITLTGSGLSTGLVESIKNVLEGVTICRDLVNEPGNVLTAVQLSEELRALGEQAGFTTEVFNKIQLESLKMGGLLSVNLGSQDPPTFSILEYKPENAKNSQPVVLVGKGVTYDTGGLSLKPTPASMDMMKCDMAGAAAIAGALYSLAKNKVPVHVIALIPATDNRPGETAMAPGDVITMYNGKTVEVMNTDAEGRLILADALCWASKYKPALVIDLATLTGAAARAIGKEGIVMMGTAPDDVKQQLQQAGHDTYERLVEFPLWEEYDKQLDSDIADFKNLGGPDAGMITAGKFLQRFTDYPWIHLDIAGPAFLTSPDSYRGKNGTGSGVRLLYQFLSTYFQQS